jgi:hypothetical protein
MQTNATATVRHIFRMAGVLLFCIVLFACGDNFRGMDSISSCVESSEKQTASPRGEYIATLYQRNCGATTGFVTHINLRRASDAVRTEANGTISKDQILLANGSPVIKLHWLDDANLVLEVDQKDRPSVVSIKESWKSVYIKLTN